MCGPLACSLQSGWLRFDTSCDTCRPRFLFNRTPHGLTLTPDGAALLPQAEKTLTALADFGLAAQSLHSTVRGRLRIGTILDPEFTRLGAFLKQLVETAPQIETELRQGMSGNVRAQLEAGALDVGFYLTPLGFQDDEFESFQGKASVKSSDTAMSFEAITLTRSYQTCPICRTGLFPP